MKTTAIVESLSYYKTNVLFQRIPTYLKVLEFVCEKEELVGKVQNNALYADLHQSLQLPDLLVTISSLQFIVFQSFQIHCNIYKTFVSDPEGIRDRNRKS